MKRFLTLLGLVILGHSTIDAQIINFPDVNFKAAIIKAYPSVDADKDNQISQEEAKSLTAIRNLANYPSIVDATGIEYFTNLTELNLKNQKLSGVLDISALAKLINLELNNNQLTGIVFPENSKLKIVYINDNALDNINLSRLNDLQRLFLVNNKLTTISFEKNTQIERIHINGNRLRTLDLSNLTKLNWFSAESNILNEIKFNNNPLLKTILTKNNELRSFDFMDGFANDIALINVDGNANFSVIHKDCSDKITTITGIVILDDCSLATSEDQNKRKINLYPSLVQDAIFVQNANNTASYQIYDKSGKLVQSAELKGSTIRVNQLTASTYYLVLKQDDATIKFSFIKL